MKGYSAVICLSLIFSLIAPGAGYAQEEKSEDLLSVKNSFLGGMSYYYDGEEISEDKFAGYIFKFNASTLEWEKSKTMKSLSTVCGVAGGALIGWPLGESIAGEDKPKWYLAGIGAALVIPAFIMEGRADRHVEKAAEAYNRIYSSINSSIPKSLEVGFSSCGVQLSYSF